MSDGQLGEETYSLIFMSLRHPIRRRILRMLADHPSSFSEILELISVDSGHLSYHLENLGELIRKPQDGKYELSSIGIAAVKLMSGVEEHQAHTSGRESRTRLTAMNVYPLILIGALIVASFFFVNFTTSLGAEGRSASPGTLIHVRPGQAFTFNITIVYTTGAAQVVFTNDSLYHERRGLVSNVTVWEAGITVVYATGMEHTVVTNDSLYHERPRPISTVTVWEEGEFWFEFTSNATYSIVVTVFRPDRSNVTSTEYNSAPGATIPLGHTNLSQSGEYVFQIKNVGLQDLQGILAVNEWWQFFERPWFYFGIACFLLALPYPVWIVFLIFKKPHA